MNRPTLRRSDLANQGVEDIEYAELKIHIRDVIEEMKLKDIDTQIAKMLQFHEVCNQRIGVGVWERLPKRWLTSTLTPGQVHGVRS